MIDYNCTELLEPKLIAFCQATQANDDDWTADMDNFFVIWASVLVLFMHAGFAMLSA